MSFLTSYFTRPISIFDKPPLLYTLLVHPITALFTFFHFLALYLRGVPYKPPKSVVAIRVVCISDTHSKIPQAALPHGDLLIHAGDLTNSGSLSDIQRTIDWLKTLLKPWHGSRDGFQHIVVVCGNHDSYFDERSRSARDKKYQKRKLDWGNIHYLQHSSISLSFPEHRTLKVYGAPQIPKCGGKDFAFQYDRGQDAWTDTVPDDVDVLVTHNPSKWHLDIPENGGLGDEFELQEVWRVRPTLHVCGHVHSGYGKEYIWWDDATRSLEALREKGFGTPRTFGFFSELVDVPLWTKGFRLIYEDVRAIIWTRIWGGTNKGCILVNAALTYRTTSRLLNKPQVVLL